MIARLLCWLDGGHFPRREPRMVNESGTAVTWGRERIWWVTRVRCRCGRVDYEVEGLP